jgi:hypothetical protein
MLVEHEACSRLFELNRLDIMEIASITGHKSLAMLKRYTLRGSGDKYAGWDWFPKVLAMPVSFGEWVSKKKSGRRPGSV